MTQDDAHQLDALDPLRSFRDQHLFPAFKGDKCLYFCGNSLGLQPKTAAAAIQNELARWQQLGVEGHFKGQPAWAQYHRPLGASACTLVGAQPQEVVIMNTLSVNLHLLMASFYRPTRKRYKILMEAGAFPSDQYAVETQVKWHGRSPKTSIVEVAPRPGEHWLHTEDIVAAIQQHSDSLALVLWPGIQYYSGQYFDLPAIIQAAHTAGAFIGLDLAHAAGNVPLQLHDWGADFAVWCNYKYLNSGPGAPGGVFIHEKYATDPKVPRLAGWWGYEEASRFQMKKGFVPMQNAEGWQLSNNPILSFAPIRASFELFDQAGILRLRQKSVQLTKLLEQIIDDINDTQGPKLTIITPRDPEARGAQLSILTGSGGRRIFDYLHADGVICDWREPNVIRLAPAPMYNSFEDVRRLGQLLRTAVNYG